MRTIARSITGHAYDGPVDPGVEQHAERVVQAAHEQRTGSVAGIGADVVAHAVLRMIAERPGQMGRARAARIVGGYPVSHRDDVDPGAYRRYELQIDWPLREIVGLVDAMLDGGLLAQTVGPRPVLVLTVAGFQAFQALEGATPRT